jgi:hypothetical protein
VALVETGRTKRSGTKQAARRRRLVDFCCWYLQESLSISKSYVICSLAHHGQILAGFMTCSCQACMCTKRLKEMSFHQEPDTTRALNPVLESADSRDCLPAFVRQALQKGVNRAYITAGERRQPATAVARRKRQQVLRRQIGISRPDYDSMGTAALSRSIVSGNETQRRYGVVAAI